MIIYRFINLMITLNYLQIHNLKKDDRTGRIVVCVGTVTDDLRLFEVPKIKVCFCSWNIIFKYI